jgi:hypothetical protein
MSAPWSLQFPTGQTQMVVGGNGSLVSYFAPNGSREIETKTCGAKKGSKLQRGQHAGT